MPKYQLQLANTSQAPLTYIHTYSGCNAQRTGGHLKHRLKLSSTTYVAQVPLTLLKYQMQLSNASQAPLTYIHTYLHTYIHTHIHTYIHAHIHTYVSQSWSTQHAIPQSSNSYRQLPSANSNSQAPHTTLKFNLLPKTQITSLEYWHQLKRLRQPRPQHLLALLAQEWLLEEINSPSAPHLKEINSSSAVFPSKQKHEKMKSHRHETFTAL